MQDEFVIIRMNIELNLETANKFINFINQNEQNGGEVEIIKKTREFEKLLKESVSAFLKNEGVQVSRINVDSILTKKIKEFQQKKLELTQ